MRQQFSEPLHDGPFRALDVDLDQPGAENRRLRRMAVSGSPGTRASSRTARRRATAGMIVVPPDCKSRAKTPGLARAGADRHKMRRHVGGLVQRQVLGQQMVDMRRRLDRVHRPADPTRCEASSVSYPTFAPISITVSPAASAWTR